MFSGRAAGHGFHQQVLAHRFQPAKPVTKSGLVRATLMGNVCTFEYPASAVSRHTLLKHLMAADLHVIEFAIDETGLQEAYLEQVRAAEAARALPKVAR